MYLDTTNEVTDTLFLDTSGSGVPELGDTKALNYKINQTNKDKWNYLMEPLINSESFSCAGKMPERRHFNQQMLIHELIRGSL